MLPGFGGFLDAIPLKPDETLAEEIPQNETAYKEANREWAKDQGLSGNRAGDFDILATALVTNILVTAACFVAFSFLRRRFPQIYANNARPKRDGGKETAPFEPSQALWGWVTAGLTVTLVQASEAGGLDSALLLEFTKFSVRVMLAIGVPSVTFLCPMHFFFGGGRAGGDRISSIGLNNVVDGHWLFWVHTAFVWYVVLAVEHMMFQAMEDFMEVRIKWLLDFHPPQAITVLVEGIPTPQRTDDSLEAFFSRIFPGKVEYAHVIKHTEKLEKLVKQLKAKRLELEKLDHARQCRSEWGSESGSSPRLSPRPPLTPEQTVEEEAEHRALEKEVGSLVSEARVERDRIVEQSKKTDPSPRRRNSRSGMEGLERVTSFVRDAPVNCCSGFVTFKDLRTAMLALHSRYTEDLAEFALSVPPEPSDIIYDDLRREPFERNCWSLVGIACIVGLFWVYLPFVVILSAMTNLKSLTEHFDFVKDFVEEYPGSYAMLDGVLSTLALVLFMSFLPTMLMLIFSSFYALKAHAWAQLKLQEWYYFFQVVYVLLVTAVGHSIVARIYDIYDHPASAVIVLADSLPNSTNFFLEFMMVQWMTEGMNITRYVQAIKYFSLQPMFGEERAVELMEPEDQEFYGIGARSARNALDIAIGIVFCSLCPVITIFTGINFFIKHIVYGYLLVFAETRKPDLGGPFYVKTMWHMQIGLLLYTLLMTGIMIQRAQHQVPALIVWMAVLYVVWSIRGFNRTFLWRELPMREACTDEAQRQAEAKLDAWRSNRAGKSEYLQPELDEEAWVAHGGDD